jgi:DNA-binding transcriptional regulator YdaS (Cro superfamily)
MTTKQDVAAYLATHIHRSGRTHKEIADEVGFENPNVVSMLKTGRTKIPLLRVPALAKAIDVEPKELLALCLRVYMPELHQVIAETMKPGW